MPFLFWMVLPLAPMDTFAFPRGAQDKQRGETRNEEQRTA